MPPTTSAIETDDELQVLWRQAEIGSVKWSEIQALWFKVEVANARLTQ